MNAAPIFPTADMLGTPRSGLLRLRNSVAEYFADRSIPITVTPVGLLYRSFSINQSGPSGANRVVFIPGEFSGNGAPAPRRYGTFSKEQRNHASVDNPRELVSWLRPFTISCWSAPDPTAPRDEGSALELSEMLVEQVVRAVHDAGAADIIWGGVTLSAPPVENGFGVELLIAANQRGPIFDETLEYTNPTNGLTADSVEMS